MRRIEQGDLDVHVPIDDLGELGRLAEGVNDLVAGIREREALREAFGFSGNLSGAYARLRKSVRTAKAAEKSHDPHRDEALHRIRKTAKRLRYTAAAVGRRPEQSEPGDFRQPLHRVGGQRLVVRPHRLHAERGQVLDRLRELACLRGEDR